MYYNNSSLAFDYRENIVTKEDKKVRTSVRTKKKNSLRRYLFFAAFYTIILCGSLLIRTVHIAEKSEQLSVLKEEYNVMINENKQLEVDINTQIDLKKVEEIAIAKLNMNTPLKNQIIYINTAPRDYGEVIAPVTEEKNSSGGIMAMIKAFTGKFAYSSN